MYVDWPSCRRAVRFCKRHTFKCQLWSLCVRKEVYTTLYDLDASSICMSFVQIFRPGELMDAISVDFPCVWP